MSFDFSTTLGGAWFPAPLFTASGCASSGKELAQFFPLREIGAVVTKSIMLKPRAGRPTPRMAETKRCWPWRAGFSRHVGGRGSTRSD